jgi:hypothetical protein
MIKTLRGQGVPVIGYTWFPLFTMIDWRYRFSQEPVENFYLELGLYRLNREAGPRWLESPQVPQFKALVADSAQSVGSIAAPQPEFAGAPPNGNSPSAQFDRVER